MAYAGASTGSITLVPKTSDSYFYESFSCRSTNSDGYTAVSFTLQGPAGGSIAVELQSKSSCSDDDGNSTSSYNVFNNVTGQPQQITLPLSSFTPEANLDALIAVAWSQFVSTTVSAWSISNVQLVCGNGAGAPGEFIPEKWFAIDDKSITIGGLFLNDIL
jgi:hypothetical protein